LKTLEKINRKGNRNSRKIGKANLAQGSPLSRVVRARARVSLSLTGGPHLSAQTRAPSLSLSRSLAVPWDQHVVAVVLDRAHLPSLCPTDPTGQCVPNLSPMISLPWTRPRPRVLQPRPSPRALLHPAPCTPTSPLPFAPSAQLSRSLSLCPRETRTSTTANKRPSPVLWPLSRPCPV
jgi:hypothetical protein